MKITVAGIGGGRFRASLDGRVLCKSSRTPFLDAARVLLKEGQDPKREIEMIHDGQIIVSMRGTIGVLAGLTVSEPDKGAGPKFAPYREHPRVLN